MSHARSIRLVSGEGQASPYVLFLSRSMYSTVRQHKSGADSRFRPLAQSPGQQHKLKSAQIPQESHIDSERRSNHRLGRRTNQ